MGTGGGQPKRRESFDDVTTESILKEFCGPDGEIRPLEP